jgi:hypothetical protein
MADSENAIDTAGLTPGDVDQAHQALVNSSSFADALASLPADLRDHVTAAAIDAFSTGVGRTMLVTAAGMLVAMVAVAFVWPRHHSTEPDRV